MTLTSDRQFPAKLLWFFALVAYAFVFLGTRGLFEPDEGRYVAVAVRMVEDHNWWLPRLHHEVPHLSKPPLTYWSLAGALELFGFSEWALRIPNACAFVLTTLLVVQLAKWLAPGKELLAGIVYATSLLPSVAYQVITTDTLLTFFETLAVWGFVKQQFDKTSLRWNVAWTSLGFALAFLTKGPPGLLPALACAAFLLRFQGWRALLKTFYGAGMWLFLAVGGSWYLAVLWAEPSAWDYWTHREIAGRLLDPAFRRNPGWRGLVEVYPPVFLAALLPWWPFALRSWLRGKAEARSPGASADKARWFLWAWLGLPLLVFFAAQSRLPLYLLPLGVPGTLLLVRSLPGDLLSSPKGRKSLAGWVLVLALLKGLAGFVATERDGRRWAEQLKPLLPQVVDELVFVHQKPLYTLQFYLGAECERVELNELSNPIWEPAFRIPAQTLKEELEEPIPDGFARVWLVESRHLNAFLSELEVLGKAFYPLGTVPPFSLFLDLPKERSSATRGSSAV